MSKFKFQEGDRVRIGTLAKQTPDDSFALYEDLTGMVGQVIRVDVEYEHWPYKVALEGKAPELFYPDFFAEEELEPVQ